MKYMIHTSPKRLWYVDDYLIPDMISKGIDREDIIIWNDDKGYGNLTSFVKSCEYTFYNFANEAGMWHMQDDIVLCDDFYDRTQNNDVGNTIVCGFYERSAIKDHPEWFVAVQTPKNMCSSFQCIYIPTYLLSKFPVWFNDKVDGRYYAGMYYYSDCCKLPTAKNNNNDDIIFKKYLKELYPNQIVINLIKPLCQHVDYIIGGSTIYDRKSKYITTNFDEEIVDRLKRKLGKAQNV